MTNKENEMLIKVVERYLFHENYKTDNIAALETLQKMKDIELAEMWMLTQGKERGGTV